MKAAYHQVEVEDEHKPRTAFTVGPYGFYQYVRMPFGLSNSPATYERIVESCLGELNMKVCVCYLDDIIIFSSDFEDHLKNIDTVFSRIKDCNLKLAAEKCQFYKQKVSFLGHVVSKYGVETDPEKISKVRDWPTPKTPEELRSFLAFTGYYRKFIKNFSKITRPLADLIPPSTKKRGPKISTKEWKWTEVEQAIFDELKIKLTSPPILAYPDFNLPFELHTDASTKGLGAVLYQDQNGTKRVIAYASRALSKSEKNYSAFKLEFLCLKWAVTDKFSDYLLNSRFSVLTDNNPLTYILTSAKLDATGQRWVSALSQYNFDLTYRSGLRNGDADAMSRYPHEKTDEGATKLDETTVKAICSPLVVPTYVETLSTAAIDIVEVTEDIGRPLAQIEMREIRRMQRADKLIERWRNATIDKRIPAELLNSDDRAMKKQFPHLFMKRGILFRKVQDPDGDIEQLVLPQIYVKQVLKGLHNDAGHPGRERTTRLLRERFYWPGMTTDVEEHIRKCDRCLRRKSPTVNRVPMINVHTQYPLELVCIDYLTLEPSKGGISNILVITDHYTKYAMAIPTRNQTAKTTAEALYNSFFVNFGIPTRLHSDQGASFESDIIKELCTLTGMRKSRTSIYHPEGNAGPERFNRTLLGMLGTLENSQKPDWKRYVNHLVYCYNCTPHESTRVSPFELMFGRKPRLPIDSMFEKATDKTASKTTREYMDDLKERMCKTRKIVEKHITKSKEQQKKNYDLRAKAAKIEVGDRVLVKTLAFEGKHKIADRFDEQMFIVDEQVGDLPVYRVRDLSTGNVKTLHRNHLFLVRHQIDTDEEQEKIEEASTDEPKDSMVSIKDKGNQVSIDYSVDTDSNSDVTDDFDTEFLVDTTRCGDACNSVEMNFVPETEEQEIQEARDESREAPTDQSTQPVTTDHVETIATEEDRLESDDIDVDVEEPEVQAEVQEEDTEAGIEQTSITDQETEPKVAQQEEPEPRPPEVEPEDQGNDDICMDATEEGPVIEDRYDDGLDEEHSRPEPTRRGEDHRDHRPTPARRSTRDRRPPERFSDYVMYGMQSGPYDVRLQAISSLVTSGALGSMDSGMAKQIIESIMK